MQTCIEITSNPQKYANQTVKLSGTVQTKQAMPEGLLLLLTDSTGAIWLWSSEKLNGRYAITGTVYKNYVVLTDYEPAAKTPPGKDAPQMPEANQQTVPGPEGAETEKNTVQLPEVKQQTPGTGKDPVQMQDVKAMPTAAPMRDVTEKAEGPHATALPKARKYKTGVPGFDDLFAEGMPDASSILLEGGPGSGKTILCLQMGYNACKQGKKTLYMSFEEPEERLRQHMRDFGWQPDEFEKNGQLRITRFNALDIARSVEALLSEAKKELLIEVQPMLFPRDFQPDFLIIDSLSAIASAFSGEENRFRIYMEQLFRYLEKMNITTILIREVANPTHTGYNYVEAGEAVSFLSDGIIIVYNVVYPNGTRGSAIEILKMRGEAIDRRIVKMEIQNKKGVIIYPNQQLTGNYRLT